MKPFLILQLRPNDAAADGEFYAMLKYGGLKEEDVHRVRMELEGVPDVDLNDYSGVLVGGGPMDISNPEEKKSPEQKRFEKELQALLDKVVAADFPYLGCCFGLSALSIHEGGVVSKEKYAEGVEAAQIILNEEGKKDKLTEGLPETFRAFAGHKESCQDLADGAVLLASSPDCPIHMIRVKNNVYGTQFHTELDIPVMIGRLEIYKDAGYFPPEEAPALMEKAKQEEITIPMKILERFVNTYKRD